MTGSARSASMPPDLPPDPPRLLTPSSGLLDSLEAQALALRASAEALIVTIDGLRQIDAARVAAIAAERERRQAEAAAGPARPATFGRRGSSDSGGAASARPEGDDAGGVAAAARTAAFDLRRTALASNDVAHEVREQATAEQGSGRGLVQDPAEP